MSVVERYLQSKKARVDIAKLRSDFARCVKGTASTNACYMEYEQDGAWEALDMRAALCLTVYVRPCEDRFIVSDLGEGVRALRIRSGRVYPWEVGHRFSFKSLDVHFSGDAIELDEVRCRVDELPEAITRVLLACYRVANLEIK